MRKKLFSMCLLSLTVGIVSQGWSQVWTPERIIHRAILVSPEIQSLQNQIEAKKGELQQAKAIPNPEVGGITGNRTQMLALGQEIEYPAKRRVRVQRVEAELEAARWQLVQAKHELAAKIMNLLYQVNAADERVGLFEQNLSVSQQLWKSAKEKFEQGFGSRLDVIKAQVEVARARRLLLNAQNEKTTLSNDMKLALGMAPSDTLELKDALQTALLPGPVKLDSLLRVAHHHPELLRQQNLVQASRLGLQAARLAGRPDFNFDLAGGIEDHESKVELELRFPLALWDRKAGLKSEAHFLSQSASNDSAAVWLDISRRVVAAVYNYRNARQTIELFKQSLVDEARTAVDMAQQAFQTGPYRFLDLIDARRTFLETAQEFIQTQIELRLAEVELLQATGILFPGEKR